MTEGLRWYLAGPMTGKKNFNFEAFDLATKALRAKGLCVVSPHEINHGETVDNRGTKPYHVYLKAGYQLLVFCDGIILLPGWTESRGAISELRVAFDCELQVKRYDPETESLLPI